MPDPRIDAYLATLDHSLRRLPAAQREDAVREVALHLDELVAQHRADGLPEDRAVTEALRQFGPAGSVGDGLRHTWASRPARLRHIIGVYVGSALVAFAFLALTMDQPGDFPSGFWTQALFALTTPAPVLSFRLSRWWRSRHQLLS